MSFTPKDWPQSRAHPQDSDDSPGPEWRSLIVRLGAAHDAKMTLDDDAGKLSRNGSFSPGSAESIGSLRSRVNQDESAGNHTVSGNGNAGVPDECEEAGTTTPATRGIR